MSTTYRGMPSTDFGPKVGTVATAIINAVGSGYHVADVLTFTDPYGAGSGATAVVTSIGASGTVTGITLLTLGSNYATGTALATTVAPSGGSGCTVNITVTGYADAANVLDSDLAIVAYGATSAIALREGTVMVGLGQSGIINYTLGTPIAGLPSAGGDDGRMLAIICLTGYAHTITTGSSVINGNKHVLTFSTPFLGGSAILMAYAGTWWLMAVNLCSATS
jgi:hypothetical protein